MTTLSTRQLGCSDLVIPEICLGTMTFGEQTGEADAHAQLDYALAQGVNFIDTAEMYAVPPRAETYGATETIVGNWLKRQQRDKIILATKVAGPARSLTWIRNGPLALDRANIRAAIEGSLRRLQTDYVDLYQLHWPERNQPMFGQWQFDPTAERGATPIREQLETLAELVREGKVRHVGVSNEHAWGLMEFVHLADELGLPRIISTQNAYHLLNRTFETGLTEIAHREQIGLLAYSPLAFGHLTGKYLADPAAAGRLTQWPFFGQRYTKPNVAPAIAAYVELARRHSLTPMQLALGFVRSRWFVSSTIIGASSLAQLHETLPATLTPLSAEILAAIDDTHLRYNNPAP
ncbi:aldo/keto reductase [Dechloromonas sp.]|uniref:aldo/keto reductase n=1 Tax=Dechloromonas sp. TaxID=1917218 RepID=UPI00121F347F|nr:aldo/keto reductase [Dechloromonas sp.]MBU3697184.1 aldo/keto reductase [Dechloromonas sp.]TEX44248.1 MAG: aldo/keto reductase [Rhodocyclaceae bacterium]